MRLFATRKEFDDILGETKKWSRSAAAIDAAHDLQPAVAYSLGDSLTYLIGSPSALTTEHLVGRRRYHLVVAAMRGTIEVEVAATADLNPVGPYDDVSDRQPFAGSGTVVGVPESGVLIVGIDEAARILPAPDGQAIRLLVTVEGATFPNK